MDQDAVKSRVLLERARTLSAREKTQTEEPGDVLLVFRSGGDRYGVLLSDLVEVADNIKLAVVPGAPPWVAGLINLRGEVRPVYHLAKLLEETGHISSEGRFVLLLRAAGREFGILAEEVEDVRSVKVSSRRPTPHGTSHSSWATEDLTAVLDVQSLFEKER
jgi:chemotaxis signal transduction protein